MRNPSKPNHLAKLIDHQKYASSNLPKPLKDKWTELNKLTQEIKSLINEGLPNEILETLWVVKFEDGKLVLSVQSQTAANHLKYQSTNLIHILKTQSITFGQLNSIDVIVSHPASIDDLNNLRDKSDIKFKHSKMFNSLDESHNKYGLTESTKRTIAYTLQHVIKDEHIKKALERVIKSN